MIRAEGEVETAERDPVGAALGLAKFEELQGSPPVGEDIDGRTLRRTRNRERVIAALLDIVRGGELDPSVADIADRAGVSHRSVFRYFDDINDLVRTAIDHETERAAPLAVIDDLGLGPFDRRVDTWVDTRLRLHAALYQVGRVARHRAPDIPGIDERLKTIYQLNVTGMRNHFASELDELGPDGGLMVDAAMVLTGFDAYDIQRRIMDHSTERIRQVWYQGMTALFSRNCPD